MSAFKLYYKIANKHKGTVIMYLAIMVLIVSLTFVQIDLSEEGAFSKGQIAILMKIIQPLLIISRHIF